MGVVTMNVHKIYSGLCFSRTTLWHLMKESNLSMERYTDTSDSSLDEIIQAFKPDQPHCGFLLVQICESLQ